jgi:hypothetical protein
LPAFGGNLVFSIFNPCPVGCLPREPYHNGIGLFVDIDADIQAVIFCEGNLVEPILLA